MEGDDPPPEGECGTESQSGAPWRAALANAITLLEVAPQDHDYFVLDILPHQKQEGILPPSLFSLLLPLLHPLLLPLPLLQLPLLLPLLLPLRLSLCWLPLRLSLSWLLLRLCWFLLSPPHPPPPL
ncbi:unnamed protein product [Arctogadus glacialis]